MLWIVTLAADPRVQGVVSTPRCVVARGWRGSCCISGMSDRDDADDRADICVPWVPRDDDDSVEAWFEDLVPTPHPADEQVSVMDVWEQILASFEALLGV